jgi:hypothetical protein
VSHAYLNCLHFEKNKRVEAVALVVSVASTTPKNLNATKEPVRRNGCHHPTRLRFARFLKGGASLPAAASHSSSVVQLSHNPASTQNHLRMK